MREGDDDARVAATQSVDDAKRALGERGPVSWDDSAPDLTRKMARTTIYADWYAREAFRGVDSLWIKAIEPTAYSKL